jgi:hypothetical protein
MQDRHRGSLFVLIAAFLCFYVVGYGVMRWRKVLIRSEYYPKGTSLGDPVITSIAPGHDLRTSSLGNFKNQVAPSVAFLFTPMRLIESAFWNARR